MSLSGSVNMEEIIWKVDSRPPTPEIDVVNISDTEEEMLLLLSSNDDVDDYDGCDNIGDGSDFNDIDGVVAMQIVLEDTRSENPVEQPQQQQQQQVRDIDPNLLRESVIVINPMYTDLFKIEKRSNRKREKRSSRKREKSLKKFTISRMDSCGSCKRAFYTQGYRNPWKYCEGCFCWMCPKCARIHAAQ